MPPEEQELLILPEHQSSPPVISGVRVTQSLISSLCIFCRSLFVFFSFFFWPLCCLFFFDLRIFITPLVSSNSSSNKLLIPNVIQFVVLMLLREFTVYVNKSEHIKGVIRIRKSKHRQHNGQNKKPYKLIRPYDRCGLTQIRPYIKWMFRPYYIFMRPTANPALYQMEKNN